MRLHLSKRRLISLIALLTLLAVVIAGALNVQRIQDTVLYYQFEPSATVASFASDAGMSEHGTFLFYASHPEVLGADDFNKQCGKSEHSTAILGCYNGRTIYIYDVTNARLTGIRSTTAAHEMLHAAYRRLSDSEKTKVNALLEAEYSMLKESDTLVSRMAYYERAQPGERGNELHSIIGTEVEVVSEELEAYYAKYLSDRSKVVAQHVQYRTVFEDLSTKSEALAAQIDQLGVSIQAQKAEYTNGSSVLRGDIANFNARANQGDFTDQAAFNRERQVLVNRSSALDDLRSKINQSVEEYNKLVAELNAIALETDTLNRSMDSQVAPAPSL